MFRIASDAVDGGLEEVMLELMKLYLEDVKKKLQNAWFKTWCTAIVFFTPASIINLSIIAPRNRLLFVNCVGLTWGVFLANTNNRAKLDQDAIPVLTGIEAEAIHAQDEKHV